MNCWNVLNWILAVIISTKLYQQLPSWRYSFIDELRKLKVEEIVLFIRVCLLSRCYQNPHQHNENIYSAFFINIYYVYMEDWAIELKLNWNFNSGFSFHLIERLNSNWIEFDISCCVRRNKSLLKKYSNY